MERGREGGKEGRTKGGKEGRREGTEEVRSSLDVVPFDREGRGDIKESVSKRDYVTEIRTKPQTDNLSDLIVCRDMIK